jgi:hypothetical protein
MATNIDAPFGLRPHNKLGSTPNSNGLTAYKVQVSATAGSSSAIYQGDMVIPLTNGLVDVSASDGGSVAILGVMAGCQYIPHQVYEIQGDASLTNIATAQALVHSNAEGTGFGSQNGSTGVSIGEISVSTAGATTATDNFRIIGIKDSFDDISVTTAGVIFLVKLNLPFHHDTTGL